MMITIYQIKENGYYGGSKEIDPSEGTGKNWVYDKPPSLICEWVDYQWIERDREPLPLLGVVNQEAEAQVIKEQANALLTDTDWTALPSTGDPLQSNPYLINQEEFIAWRSQVRAIALNPSYDSVIPTQPVEKWSS